MNNALLQGTIATQPQLRYTPDGDKQICEFSISFPGQKAEDPPENMKAIAWGDLAQTISIYTLGLEVILEGRVDIRKVQSQGEGYSDPIVQFVASRIHPIGTTAPIPMQQPVTAPAVAQTTAKARSAAAERTPVTPVSAMAGGGGTADYEPSYDDIPF